MTVISKTSTTSTVVFFQNWGRLGLHVSIVLSKLRHWIMPSFPKNMLFVCTISRRDSCSLVCSTCTIYYTHWSTCKFFTPQYTVVYDNLTSLFEILPYFLHNLEQITVQLSTHLKHLQWKSSTYSPMYM